MLGQHPGSGLAAGDLQFLARRSQPLVDYIGRDTDFLRCGLGVMTLQQQAQCRFLIFVQIFAR